MDMAPGKRKLPSATTKLQLPLEMVGIAKNLTEELDPLECVSPLPGEIGVSEMISKIQGRAEEELRCYVRVFLMRTGFM